MMMVMMMLLIIDYDDYNDNHINNDDNYEYYETQFVLGVNKKYLSISNGALNYGAIYILRLTVHQISYSEWPGRGDHIPYGGNCAVSHKLGMHFHCYFLIECACLCCYIDTNTCSVRCAKAS